MATGQVHCYTCTCMSSCHLYLCLASTLEGRKWQIPFMDLEAMVPHGVADIAIIYFAEYFSVLLSASSAYVC